jgi:hypothetical protein
MCAKPWRKGILGHRPEETGISTNSTSWIFEVAEMTALSGQRRSRKSAVYDRIKNGSVLGPEVVTRRVVMSQLLMWDERKERTKGCVRGIEAQIT